MSTDDDSPSDVYGGQVSDIIAAQPRASDYRPAHPVELFVVGRRAIASTDALEPAELAHDFPIDLEAARVVDDKGVLRYRLYGWSFGVVYLMAAEGLECIAFAAQHDLEHWHADQREIFWAMDGAMRRNDHGFRQPMKFCWWEEKCWKEIADEPRGGVQSEPYIRKQFA